MVPELEGLPCDTSVAFADEFWDWSLVFWYQSFLEVDSNIRNKKLEHSFT